MIPINETYDFKYHVAYYILPRLKEFKEIFDKRLNPTIPFFDEKDLIESGFSDEEEYYCFVLNKMIMPFEYFVDERIYDDLSAEDLHKNFKEGMMLFAKYFYHMSI